MKDKNPNGLTNREIIYAQIIGGSLAAALFYGILFIISKVV